MSLCYIVMNAVMFCNIAKSQMNVVDLPTLGSPTIPHFNAISLYFFLSS